MCDVDEEAVVAAVDAPSIYDIPKVLHTRGARRLCRATAQPAVPRRRLDGWDDLLQRVHHPAEEVTSRSSESTSTCPTPTSRSPRRCGPAASTTTARVNIRWVASDDCRTPEGAARLLGDVDGVCVPGGFGVRGIEGKLGA